MEVLPAFEWNGNVVLLESSRLDVLIVDVLAVMLGLGCVDREGQSIGTVSQRSRSRLRLC